jgi:hypothetical protein
MWATGRVRDRVAHAAAKRRWGQRFFPGLPGKNGGAPSSLTRPQSPHHHWTSARETSPNACGCHQDLPHKPLMVWTPPRGLGVPEWGSSSSRRGGVHG